MVLTLHSRMDLVVMLLLELILHSNNYTHWTSLQTGGGVAEGKTLTTQPKLTGTGIIISAVKVNGTILTTGTLDNTDSVWSNVNEWKDGNADL